jgi:hypothetical protein
MSNQISRHQPLPAARRAGNQVSNSSPFEWLARAGFIARGCVYLIIGVLAAKLALGAGGKTTDQEGALKTVACNRRARTHWRAKPLPGLPWLQAGRMP